MPPMAFAHSMPEHVAISQAAHRQMVLLVTAEGGEAVSSPALTVSDCVLERNPSPTPFSQMPSGGVGLNVDSDRDVSFLEIEVD
jgi:hypothetical protein